MTSHEIINEYLDFYEELLTDKQKNIMNCYYREDYSLSEIAENYNITRSAVQDNIKKTVKKLEHYETKLHLVKKYQKRLAIYGLLQTFEDLEIKKITKQLIESEDESYE